MICVVVASLTPSQTCRAFGVAESIFDSVYKLHGLPGQIISDRDSLFTFEFWERLHHLLNTELRMSLVFHPQTDDAIERASRKINLQCSEDSESTEIAV